MICVVFQDGGISTFATRLSREQQLAEARSVIEGANDGVPRGDPQAYIAECAVTIGKKLR